MTQTKAYAVVPAAGIGTRMQSEIPKQYLQLAGKTVIEHTLARLLDVNEIEKIVVVIAEHDDLWPSLLLSRHPRLVTAPGGAERCHSVLNGLQALAQFADDTSWVLVHDAARPCVRVADITQMFTRLDKHPVGGILASPVRDTLKRSTVELVIDETVDRTGLWQAFTPQMFRFDLLTKALREAVKSSVIVTDEAQAVERQSYKPILIEGHTDNIKITRPEDLALAALYLAHQADTSS